MAEGEKEAAILRAEAEKEAAIKRAEGEAEAILKIQQAQAEGIRMLNAADPECGGWDALKYPVSRVFSLGVKLTYKL